MKLLHTSDWHTGKTLRGESRLAEHRAVLDEITQLARDEAVDVVLVTGDLFESAAPPPDAQRVVWEALLALRDTGAHVVAIGGNHDNQHGLDAWAAVFRAAGITLLGHATRPELGGVVELTSRRGDEHAVVALLPFVSQRFAVRTEQLLELDAAQTAGLYAERMRLLIDTLTRSFRPDTVNVLAAHCFVRGGVLGGGERDAHTVHDYAIDGVHLPVAANYVALGHLHRSQRIEAPAPAWYAGSPIQVDFGEERDVKHVLLVEAAPGVPARVDVRPLRSGWTLRTLTGTLSELRAAAAAGVGDAWLRVVVREPARAGLAEEVRALLPRAVDIRVARSDDARPDTLRPSTASRSRSARELFAEYLVAEGVDDPRVLSLFDRLYDDAVAEAVS